MIPKAITIDELDSSDISDNLEEMKIRAQYKHLTGKTRFSDAAPVKPLSLNL